MVRNIFKYKKEKTRVVIFLQWVWWLEKLRCFLWQALNRGGVGWGERNNFFLKRQLIQIKLKFVIRLPNQLGFRCHSESFCSVCFVLYTWSKTMNYKALLLKHTYHFVLPVCFSKPLKSRIRTLYDITKKRICLRDLMWIKKIKRWYINKSFINESKILINTTDTWWYFIFPGLKKVTRKIPHWN